MQRLAVILMAGVLAGCACTLIGCVNRIEFNLAHDLVKGVHYDVEVCLDGQCSSVTLMVKDREGWVVASGDGLGIDTDRDGVVLGLEGDDYSGVHDLSVTVRNETGDMLTDHTGTYEFVKTEPNGGGWCGPTCWHAVIEAPAARLP